MNCRQFLLRILSLLLVAIPFLGIAGDKAMLGIDHMIYVEVNKQNCEVELYINGIPVARLSAKESSTSEPAHQYLIDGANEIELLIYPGQTPSQARTAQRELGAKGAYAMAKLVKYPVGVYPGDASGEILGMIKWSGQETKKEMFPKSVTTKIELGPLFGRWQWQDAEPLTLDKKTLSEISAYVEKFYAAFLASNGQEIQKLARVRLEEGGKALPGKDTAQADALFLRDVGERKQNKHWKVTPLRPALFDFRLCAQGRMVEIVNTDWEPTIRGVFNDNSDDPYTYPMFLSKIKGQWVMVR